MLEAFPRFDSWHPQLLETLLRTSDLRWLWTLQETSGSTAADLSGNNRTGTYDGVTLDQFAPNRRINKMVGFDGVNDKIDAAAGCSVRGLSAITFVAVLSMTGTARQHIYGESVGDSVGSSRFDLERNANGGLSVFCRSGVASQSVSSAVTNNPVPRGAIISHVTVSIPDDEITISINGVAQAVTTSVDFGSDTVFADTAPQRGPTFGRNTAAAPRWYAGRAAYVGLYSRVLTSDEILAHARAGGFAG